MVQTNKRRGRKPAPVNEALSVGVSANALAKMFRMDIRTVEKRLADLKPNGDMMGVNLYFIPDAAAILLGAVTPSDDQLIKMLESLPRSKMPPKLTDTFWKAMLNKLKFEEEAGQLWRTQDVYDMLANVLVNMRSTVNLFAATVNRETRLTEQQRNIIIALCDELLEDTADKMSKDDTANNFVNALERFNREESEIDDPYDA